MDEELIKLSKQIVIYDLLKKIGLVEKKYDVSHRFCKDGEDYCLINPFNLEQIMYVDYEGLQIESNLLEFKDLTEINHKAYLKEATTNDLEVGDFFISADHSKTEFKDYTIWIVVNIKNRKDIHCIAFDEDTILRTSSNIKDNSEIMKVYFEEE